MVITWIIFVGFEFSFLVLLVRLLAYNTTYAFCLLHENFLLSYHNHFILDLK